MKALLATPLIDGKADREFVTGLLQAHGLYAGWICVEGQANISRARDMLVEQFLGTDCTTLVFIDGDIGYGYQDLQLLLASPHPITAGLYLRKSATRLWVCDPQPDQGEPVAGQPELRRVRRVGTGFLRIDRSVLIALVDGGHVAPYQDPSRPDKQAHQFFPSGLWGHEYLSEDYYFCELAARAGFGIHVDTRIKLRHAGRRIYRAD